jgi:hypothetical protein
MENVEQNAGEKSRQKDRKGSGETLAPRGFEAFKRPGISESTSRTARKMYSPEVLRIFQ